MDFELQNNAEYTFNKWKELFNNRDILIVEGIGTKFGYNNDLLNNSKQVQRIICPSKNAYEYIFDIYHKILKYGKNKLILCCLGPTASVLSYKISQVTDFQILDMGHLDIEYEWFKQKTQNKTQIE